MNKNLFLDSLKSFTEEAVKDLLLPTKVQRAGEEPERRAATVYKMRLSDSKAATKKAPYILHQIITSEDGQNPGEDPHSLCTVRTIFCVYCDDEQEGSLNLLNLMERLRIALLKRRVIGEMFYLDLTEKLETMIYPDDTAPYYAGEMVTTWQMPVIHRVLGHWPEHHDDITIDKE